MRNATVPHGGRSAVAAFGGYLARVDPVLRDPRAAALRARLRRARAATRSSSSGRSRWWPHAILHGAQPVRQPRALGAGRVATSSGRRRFPGSRCCWRRSRSLAGPVAAYNVAAILLPALAALTAFLLCRHLTRSFWPSLAGGYLFGFSSYILGHELGAPAPDLGVPRAARRAGRAALPRGRARRARARGPARAAARAPVHLRSRGLLHARALPGRRARCSERSSFRRHRRGSGDRSPPIAAAYGICARRRLTVHLLRADRLPRRHHPDRRTTRPTSSRSRSRPR